MQEERNEEVRSPSQNADVTRQEHTSDEGEVRGSSPRGPTSLDAGFVNRLLLEGADSASQC